MNIYVGNLSQQVTENDLRDAFESFGQVTDIKIIKDRFTSESKGFGFIEMPAKQEAETAMEDLKEIGPHFMFGAPRIYEAIRSEIWLKIDESYRINKLAYDYFIKLGEKAAKYRMSGEKMPFLLEESAAGQD